MFDGARVRVIKPFADGVMASPGGEPSLPVSGPGTDLGFVLTQVSEHRRWAEAQAEAILQGAQGEAARLLAEAKAQAAEERQRGYAEGYAAGEAAARAQVAAEAEHFLQLLRSAVESVRHMEQEALEQARGAILKITVALAEKVVRSHLQVHPAAIEALLDDLLPRWEGAENVVIRCHPEDAETAAAYLERSGLAERLFQGIRVEPAEHVTKGGCIVESEFGELDARLETRLSRVTERFRQWAREEGAGQDEG